MVLIGGAASFCSSYAEDNCDVENISWQEQAQKLGFDPEVVIKKEDLYQVTSETIKGLDSLTGYPKWALKDLQKLDQSKQYTMEEFRVAIALIDSNFYSDLTADQWYATVGYMTIIQKEIVSFEHSPVYTKDLTKKFIEFSGGANSIIGIVTSSTGDDIDSYIYYGQAFKDAGAQEVVWIPIDMPLRKAREMNDCDNMEQYVADIYQEYDTNRRYKDLSAQHIQACKNPDMVFSDLNRITGIFFSGGDQSRHKDSFINSDDTDSEEMAIIRARVNKGEVAVSGTSAGTAVQCGPSKTLQIPMIAGGESYYALVDEPRTTPCQTSKCADDLYYDPNGGLNLFTYGILDTHFSQRGRQGRISRLALLTKIRYAFAVDETTGLVIAEKEDDPNIVNFEVVGEYGVSLFDYSDATTSNTKQFSASNIQWNYLTSGDKFTLNQKENTVTFTVASYKDFITEINIAPKTSTDVFSSPDRGSSGRENYMEFVVLGQSLADSKSTNTIGETYETNPIYKVEFGKNLDTQSFKGVNSYNDLRYSILNMSINITPKFEAKELFLQ